MQFTFPTTDEWLLVVFTFIRPIEENIQAACFCWWRTPGPLPAGLTQFDFEQSFLFGGTPTAFNSLMGDGVRVGYNYYLQSNGMKGSNAVNIGITAGLLSAVLPLGNSACITRYTGARKDQWCGRLNIPFPLNAYVGANGRWNIFGKGNYQNVTQNIPLGFNIGGWGHFTNVVYRPTSDTFVPVTAMRLLPTPRFTRRRRFRQRKVGHTFGPALQWRVAGHF